MPVRQAVMTLAGAMSPYRRQTTVKNRKFTHQQIQKTGRLRRIAIVAVVAIAIAAQTGCWSEKTPGANGAEMGAQSETLDTSGAESGAQNGATNAKSAEIEALYESVLSYVSGHGLGDITSLQQSSDSLFITISGDACFPPGRAVVLPEMQLVCADIAQILADTYNPENPFVIVVTGHTEDVPANPAGHRHASLWALSFDRAASILEILITRSNLDQGYFYARGSGEERPIAPNDTPEGRQANRRIEIVISSRNGSLLERFG